jgi:hypothetical protein
MYKYQHYGSLQRRKQTTTQKGRSKEQKKLGEAGGWCYVLGGASALMVPASGTVLLIGRVKGVWLMHGGISQR